MGSGLRGLSMDAVDKALEELADYAFDSWSNVEIVKRINVIREMHKAQQDAAESHARHARAMRDEVCAVMGVTPGALVGLPAITP